MVSLQEAFQGQRMAAAVLVKLLAVDGLPMTLWMVNTWVTGLGGHVSTEPELRQWADYLDARVSTRPMPDDDRVLVEANGVVDGISVRIACLTMPGQALTGRVNPRRPCPACTVGPAGAISRWQHRPLLFALHTVLPLQGLNRAGKGPSRMQSEILGLV